MSALMPGIAPSNSWAAAVYMKPVVFKSRQEKINSSELDYCHQQLKKGELIVLPTDTVYGVGCHAFKPDGIHHIYQLKGRSYQKPLPLLIAKESQLSLIVTEVLPEAKRLMKAFWPGPLTLVFKTAPLAMHATRGNNTVAVRIPDHGVVKKILDELEFPLAMTSANPSGKPSSRSFTEAYDYFKDQVSLFVDGGVCPVSVESTVVDVTYYPFTIIRVGALSKSQIEKAVLPA